MEMDEDGSTWVCTVGVERYVYASVSFVVCKVRTSEYMYTILEWSVTHWLMSLATCSHVQTVLLSMLGV